MSLINLRRPPPPLGHAVVTRPQESFPPCYATPMQPSTILTVTFLTGAGLLGLGGSPTDFADPVSLTSSKAQLGGKVRYPSPRLVDIDGDGAREMIVGDLSGFLRVARLAAGEDALAWGELAPFTTDGRELKFNNW